MTRRILEGAGYKVLAQPTARGAGRRGVPRTGDSVDLLLSDVVMPEMLGPELARRLRERKPSIRVLFMSGFAQPSLGEAMELGTVEMIREALHRSRRCWGASSAPSPRCRQAHRGRWR